MTLCGRCFWPYMEENRWLACEGPICSEMRAAAAGLTGVHASTPVPNLPGGSSSSGPRPSLPPAAGPPHLPTPAWLASKEEVEDLHETIAGLREDIVRDRAKYLKGMQDVEDLKTRATQKSVDDEIAMTNLMAEMRQLRLQSEAKFQELDQNHARLVETVAHNLAAPFKHLKTNLPEVKSEPEGSPIGAVIATASR